jgi:hypothetical protein
MMMTLTRIIVLTISFFNAAESPMDCMAVYEGDGVFTFEICDNEYCADVCSVDDG